MHAVLMDILGLGVLIVGESGIGKSECALDLIVRGHRLVADDTVEIRRRAESVLIGTCPDLTRHHMEVRGLGLINIKDLFGVAVDALVQARRAGRAARALGAGPRVRAPGPRRRCTTRSSACACRCCGCRSRRAATSSILVEVAARNQLLRSRGHHAARKLAARLERQLREPEADAAARRRPGRADRGGRREGAARHAARQRPAPRERQPVHRPHRAVGRGQVAGDPRARGPRLLLRGQPADRRSSRRWPSCRLRAERRAEEGGDRRGRAGGELPVAASRRSLRKLRAMRGLDPVLIFLEASDAALVRRFSETRRPHPLAHDRPVIEGIREERERLAPIRELADEIVDTTDLTVHELREAFMAISRGRSPRARACSSPSRASASSTACRPRPTWSSTCGACRTRTSCPSCGGGPAATGRSSQFMEAHAGDAARSSSGSPTSCAS